MSLRLVLLAAVALGLWIAPVARAAAPQRLTWEELPQLVGKHVSIALYEGGAVAGKVREVQADALLIEVSKSTDPAVYPKGPLRVPRATLHVLDLNGKGFKYRVTAAGTALVSIMAGVTAAGYAVGNAADRRTTTIRIIH